jgi:ABC-2 type transport system permease protein
MVLLGAAMIAIGMFISAMTENQVIAAVGGFAVGFALIMVDSLSGLITLPWLSKFVAGLSFLTRYSSFTTGILDIANVFFFVSVVAVFVFLTVRVFEKRRWS